MSSMPAFALNAPLEAAAPGLTIDPSYPPVQLPKVTTASGAVMTSLAQPLSFSLAPAESIYLVRGVIPDGACSATPSRRTAEPFGPPK